MPRRKKRGNNLPPLQFVQSPVYQDTPNRHDYYYENFNPATARVVPIDDLDNFPWVSPQFKNRLLTQRVRSSRAKKSLTRLRRSKSEGSVPDYIHLAGKSRFPPLQFFQPVPKSIHSKQAGDNVALEQSSAPLESATEVHEGKAARKCSVCESAVLNGNRKCKNCELQNDVCTVSNRCTDSMSDVITPPAQHFQHTMTKTNNVVYHSTPVDTEANDQFLNQWNSHTPPRNSQMSQVKVLVADTPECDYGLGMRQRQLKYFSC